MKALYSERFGYLILIISVCVLLYLFSASSTAFFSLNNKNLTESSSDSITNTIAIELVLIDKKLQKVAPKSTYLTVNSTANEFYLYDGQTLLKHDKCSTGSYVLLKNGDLQQWIFKTPKGEFKVLGKIKNPVWKKPDWAFVEEGLPIPSINHLSRYEYGVLGDYALSLGDGYLIHGTIYQRFIGLPVTHGCIRLNDENLELIYKKLPVGSKVYLF